MKKTILAIVLFTGSLFWACEDKLKEEFNDPERYSAPEDIIPAGMFTKVIYSWKVFIQDYGEWWWQMGGWSATAYTQIGVRPMISNYDGIYDYWNLMNGDGFSDENSIRSYFYDMYDRLRPWGVMKTTIDNADEAYKKENYTYFALTSIIKDYCLLRNVDFFNSIPYKEALKGLDNVFFTPYDNPDSIYVTGLNSIKAMTDILQASYDNMSPAGQSLFKTQDIVFQGDIQQWIRWANAIRLKFAVRLSGVNENEAKIHIQDILSKNMLPVGDMYWKLPFDQVPDVVNGGGETWTRGLYERFTSIFIPNVIMKRMNLGSYAYEEGIDDPRLPVLAMPTRWGDYRGVRMDRGYRENQPTRDSLAALPATPPPGWTEEQWTWNKTYINNNGNYRKEMDIHLHVNSVSPYNYYTYFLNEFPVYMMSQAEVDLFLAEIALNNLGNTGKSPQEHLVDAMKHSTDFWYGINAKCTFKSNSNTFPDTDFSVLQPNKPSADKINAYANVLRNTYNTASDKLEIIMQQKFIHLNLMGTYELWAEQRRTRRPKLEPVTTRTMTNVVAYPERAKYPSNEASVNMEYYMQVKDQDNFVSPVFWVKNKSESCFGGYIN